ncbi:NAD-dependent epimerase/dehydratase family protein [Variovorax sp. J22P168]|uniref:NAD-dependent epimerase/dehydratase family protein n=1 Tax=Variovorax jilinensis TaxID=3053513 RepID=UPI00257766AB|nr:NAD-dependent epimerase/dehydratase family protein [Variovorax sp. J22P168]MDM0012100.1 NAD-dependent epimerase/dehydratase family protein [Variovorax sp. J22P168]
MKRVLITGAAGFVGGLLARRLSAADAGIEQLVLADRASASVTGSARWIEGDLADPAFVDRLAAERCDTVFQLASQPGGQAEREPARGRRINLDATLDLFEAVASAGTEHGARPVMVFASSIAVYGTGLTAQVDDRTPLHPALSYGAHKRMAEIALADFVRRGELEGCSLRLPGIVARPRGPAGQASAFMSELMHALAAGERFVCPVSAQASAWWMSGECAVRNLLHAARLDASAQQPGRTWQLPVLRLSLAQVVDALAQRFGDGRRRLVEYQPDDALEAIFGRYPPLDDRLARVAGFVDDATPALLIANALQAHEPLLTTTQGDNHDRTPHP